ncbi:MAG: alpha/beta hydrolase [Gammaproteobacteria bacterium]|nr:alpha/beta hydrolase [Gammaproteobacteria bacterium]MDE0413980.1 alpha/beta hydrolase [Gammaproteobacteria bacterium]
MALLPQRSPADWDYSTVEGAGGVPLNVVTAGDPASLPILLIHGFGQSHYSFVHQLNSDLAEDYFLVAFDLRGHGASGKPWAAEDYSEHTVWAEDVAAVVSATGIERPVVVAWSYGTMIAMDYIREFGVDGMAGLLLTGGQGALKPFRMPAADDPGAEEFARIRELQQSPALIDYIRAGERVIPLLTASPLPESERQLFQAIGMMLPAYVRRAMVHRSLDNQDLVDRLTLPVLFALGAEDNPFQLEDAADLAASRENVSLIIYEGAGHSVFLEQPERFNDQLRRFAEETRSDAVP